MSIQIVQASPQSDTAEEPKRRATVGSIRYPFAALEVGQAFTVPLATANVRSLRQLVRRHSQGDKRFVLVIHEAYNVVEIARKLPLPVAAVVPEPMPAWAIIPATAVEAQQTPTAFAPPGPSWEAPQPPPAESPTAESLGWGAPQ